MLKGLLDLVRPLFLTDPVFGQLRFQRVGFWEGHVAFPPVGATVEVLLDGSAAGPTENQRRCFHELAAKYSSLWPLLKTSLDRSLADWQTGGAVGQQGYRLVAIDIPPSALASAECDLSYETVPSGLHLTAKIRGWKIVHVVVEC